MREAYTIGESRSLPEPRTVNDASTAYVPTSDPVSRGQLCTKCGYDLTGLSVGAPCPECGRPIGSSSDPRKRKVIKQDSIGLASEKYLRRLSLGFLALGLSGLTLWAALVLSMVFPAIDYMVRAFNVLALHQNSSGWAGQAAGSVSPGFLSFVAILLCVGASAATWLTYFPRTDAPESKKIEPFAVEWTLLRKVVVGTQSVWVLVPLLGIGELLAPGHGLVWFASFALVIAVGGIAPAAWLLGDYADWANDLSTSARLRAVPWAMAAAVVYVIVASVLFAVGFGMGWFLMLWSWIFGGIFVLGIAVYFFSALQLAGTAHWAIINAEEEAARDARMLEKARKREEQARAAPQEAFPTAVPDREMDEVERKHREAEGDPDLEKARELIGRNQKQVIGRGDGETYDLESDEKPDSGS